MTEYRMKRTDTKNIAIQRKVDTIDGSEKWLTISYHGHSVNSLVSGLLQLVLRDYDPGDRKLLETVLEVQLELVLVADKIERMIKESDIV